MLKIFYLSLDFQYDNLPFIFYFFIKSIIIFIFKFYMLLIIIFFILIETLLKIFFNCKCEIYLL